MASLPMPRLQTDYVDLPCVSPPHPHRSCVDAVQIFECGADSRFQESGTDFRKSRCVEREFDR